MPNVTGKSFPVRTRCTPGCACARATSIDSISAWACGERRSFKCSMRGSAMSSAKRVCPVTLARPSTRRRGLPTTFIVHPPRTLFDGLDDLLVARAAAEIARDRFLDAAGRRLRLAREQRLGAEQDAGRAIAALRGAKIGKGRLQRMQLGATRHAFYGLDRAPFAFEPEQQAGELRLAIDQHRAGAALAELAAMLGTREPEVLAQHLEQRLVRRGRSLDGFAVHREQQV